MRWEDGVIKQSFGGRAVTKAKKVKALAGCLDESDEVIMVDRNPGELLEVERDV